MVQTHHSHLPVHEPTCEVTCCWKALIATVITLATVDVVLQTSQACYNPELYHMSILLGKAWVNKMLDGHHDRLMDNTGVQKDVFKKLK
ncbi:hypothetical protein L208DRAFT_1260101 [Tricholoma matsutake]|nr:hypothetical protein L208DRAFT_1260101 [Tricholoma matsutake 945]